MKPDLLQKYISLRSELLKEKRHLESRLRELSQTLGTAEAAAPTAALARAKQPVRLDNPMPLKQAVAKVTSAKPLSKKEILAAIAKLGYRFAAKNPITSLNSVLYIRGNFKNTNGKFSPASKVGASKPGGAKRVQAVHKAAGHPTMTPEIRAKIAQSQRARWAKIKAARK